MDGLRGVVPISFRRFPLLARAGYVSTAYAGRSIRQPRWRTARHVGFLRDRLLARSGEAVWDTVFGTQPEVRPIDSGDIGKLALSQQTERSFNLRRDSIK